MRKLIEEVKKTVIFLGKENEKGQPEFSATGFLLKVENIVHLTTARHVVIDPQTGQFIDSGMLAFFNLKDGGFGARSIGDLKQRFRVDWTFHEREDIDIAIMPFGLNPETDDVKTIPDELFLTPDRLSELYDIFFLSYQPGIDPGKRLSPVMRNGTISLINDDQTFYVDAAAFPGNSGSPVFVKPSAVRFDEGGIRIGSDPLSGKFVGLVGQYLPYREAAISAQTGRVRVVFEENTGLSKVWSVNFINEILESESMKRQVQEARKR